MARLWASWEPAGFGTRPVSSCSSFPRPGACPARGGPRQGGPGGWYLLQQQGPPALLGKVVGGEGALDPCAHDDGIVQGAAGRARSSHVQALGAGPRGGSGAKVRAKVNHWLGWSPPLWPHVAPSTWEAPCL